MFSFVVVWTSLCAGLEASEDKDGRCDIANGIVMIMRDEVMNLYLCSLCRDN
jgi:hypothetical protein